MSIFTTGSIQSLNGHGQGRVYFDVGWTEILVTFDGQGNPTAEIVATAGQHSDTDPGLILCELFAPA